MSVSHFKIPVANKPLKPIRTALPTDLFDEVALWASSSGIEPIMVIKHTIAYALTTRKNKRTNSRHNNDYIIYF